MPAFLALCIVYSLLKRKMSRKSRKFSKIQNYTELNKLMARGLVDARGRVRLHMAANFSTDTKD